MMLVLFIYWLIGFVAALLTVVFMQDIEARYFDAPRKQMTRAIVIVCALVAWLTPCAVVAALISGTAWIVRCSGLRHWLAQPVWRRK